MNLQPVKADVEGNPYIPAGRVCVYPIRRTLSGSGNNHRSIYWM